MRQAQCASCREYRVYKTFDISTECYVYRCGNCGYTIESDGLIELYTGKYGQSEPLTECDIHGHIWTSIPSPDNVYRCVLCNEEYES